MFILRRKSRGEGIVKPKEIFPIYENSDLIVKMDLSIFSNQRQPKGVAKNHEYMMLDIITKALSINQKFIHGEEDCGEPDFINLEKTFGLEMTFIDRRDGKPLIYGIKEDKGFELTDKDAIQWIKEAVEAKASKKENGKYTIESIYLVAMFPVPIESWAYPNCIMDSYKLSKTFYELNQKYVQRKILEDIFIIVPSPNQKMTVYTVSVYCDLEHFALPNITDWDDDRLNII